MFGNLSLCAVNDASSNVSFLAGDDLASIWDQFEGGSAVTLDGAHGYGAPSPSVNASVSVNTVQRCAHPL